MSTRSLLVRFGLTYAGLIALATTVAVALSIEVPSGVNAALLMGAVLVACSSYAKANDRPVPQAAKPRVVLGMLGIDLAVQAVLVLFASAGGVLPEIPLVAWAGVAVGVGALHALMIYWAIGLAGRQFLKQAEKAPANGG